MGIDLVRRREYSKQYRLNHREEARAYQKEYRQSHKEERAANQRRYCLGERAKIYYRGYAKEYAFRLKGQVLAHYSNGELKCARCEIADIDVLTIDHMNGGGKAHRKLVGSGITLYCWLRKNNYPNGYQTLCFNCNIKKYLQGGD